MAVSPFNFHEDGLISEAAKYRFILEIDSFEDYTFVFRHAITTRSTLQIYLAFVLLKSVEDLYFCLLVISDLTSLHQSVQFRNYDTLNIPRVVPMVEDVRVVVECSKFSVVPEVFEVVEQFKVVHERGRVDSTQALLLPF